MSIVRNLRIPPDQEECVMGFLKKNQCLEELRFSGPIIMTEDQQAKLLG